MPSHPVIIELDFHHYCWFIDLTGKNPLASLRVASPGVVEGGNITNIVDLTTPTPKQDIEFIKKHPIVKRVDVLFRKPNGALLRVTQSYDGMSLKALEEAKGILLEPTVTSAEKDREVALIPTPKAADKFIKQLREGGFDTRLLAKRFVRDEDKLSLDFFRTSGFLSLSTTKDMLTPKQLEVFELACRNGYYDIPKKITLEELAEDTGLHPATLAEHLHKAEAKLLPILADVMKKI